MNLPKWPWWGWALAILLGLGIISAIVSPETPEPAVKDAREPKIIRTASLPSDLPAYTMLVEAGAAPGLLTEKARDLCGSASHCAVTGWTDASFVGRGWPLTQREADAAAYTYAVNRSTGYEGEIWDCTKFPEAPKERCASKP